MSADHNLHFGVLALQNNFVSHDQLVESMNAWAVARHRPLSDLLRECGQRPRLIIPQNPPFSAPTYLVGNATPRDRVLGRRRP